MNAKQKKTTTAASSTRLHTSTDVANYHSNGNLINVSNVQRTLVSKQDMHYMGHACKAQDADSALRQSSLLNTIQSTLTTAALTPQSCVANVHISAKIELMR